MLSRKLRVLVVSSPVEGVGRCRCRPSGCRRCRRCCGRSCRCRRISLMPLTPCAGVSRPRWHWRCPRERSCCCGRRSVRRRTWMPLTSAVALVVAVVRPIDEVALNDVGPVAAGELDAGDHRRRRGVACWSGRVMVFCETVWLGRGGRDVDPDHRGARRRCRSRYWSPGSGSCCARSCRRRCSSACR